LDRGPTHFYIIIDIQEVLSLGNRDIKIHLEDLNVLVKEISIFLLQHIGEEGLRRLWRNNEPFGDYILQEFPVIVFSFLPGTPV